MAGRKSKIDKAELFKLLKTFKTEIVNALGKSTDPLWKSLCSKLDNKISPSGLYLIIQNNRYNCHDILHLDEKNYFQKVTTKDVSPKLSGLDSLLSMKYEEHLYTIIHKIGLDPFYVFYWTPAQTIIFNEYVKNENMSKLFIDATESICQRIERPNKNKSSHIFLYQGVIHSGTISGQLVTQMLSECHNINQITHWLSEWSANIKIPKIVVCDHSMALLGAIARSLAGEINLKSYMDKLFSVAAFLSNMNVKTFIRIDYAHVMKFLSNWKCFTGKETTVKKFYLKLMSRLIMCTSLKSAEGLIDSILMTSNSIFEGHDERNNELTSETAKLYLKQLIAGMDEICVSDDDDADDDLVLSK